MTAPSYPPRPSQLTEWHLGGQVGVYLRVSTPHQVQHHLGSGMAQRAQVELLRHWGFKDSQIIVIDEDMGRSGTSTKHRSGWQTLLAGIIADAIRVVVMIEVSRLGRDHVELARFLALCEYKNVLLIDNGVPRDVHEVGDWTTMAIEGVLAEQENRRKTGRIRNSLNAKVQAGLWPRQLPPGFDRGPGGEAIKTADPAVREILERVWREALLGKSARRIALDLRADGLKLPIRGPRHTHQWVQPTAYGVRKRLNNPFYAGQLLIWKHRREKTPDGPVDRPTTPREQRTLPGKIETYVTVEAFQQVKALLHSRDFRTKATVGLGAALCARLLLCLQCKRRLHVNYNSWSKPTRHYYQCYDPKMTQDRDHKCMWVSGRQLDRKVEEVVLTVLQTPSPAALRQAIEEENTRRQSSARLLAEQVRQADAEVVEARARLEESRQRARNLRVMELYEDELNTILDQQQAAKARFAAVPTVPLINTSAAFVREVAAVFAQLPHLWRSGRLKIEDRKHIVRLVIDRIEVIERTDPTPVRIVLHSGQVVDRLLFGYRARYQLVQALAAEGRNPEEIADELNRRNIVNKRGRPYDATAIKVMIVYPKSRRAESWSVKGKVTIDLLRALWQDGLSQSEIAARMNAQSQRTHNGRAWTISAVMYWAKRLKLTSRRQITRETLRAPLTELVQAGWDDAAIAEEFNARGVTSYMRKSWIACRIARLRHQLGVYKSDRETVEQRS